MPSRCGLRRIRRRGGGGLLPPFSVIKAVPPRAVALLSEAFLAFLAMKKHFSNTLDMKRCTT